MSFHAHGRLWSMVGLVCALLATSAPAAIIDGRIAYLDHQRDKSADSFAGTVRFHGPPERTALADLRAAGLVFSPHHSRTVYPARIPFTALTRLTAHDDVAAVGCAWRRRPTPPMSRYLAAVEGDLAQQVASPLGGTLTGRGVTVADLDTGVEADHMSLFQLTAERYDWHDNDGSGDLTSGDSIDLNSDGQHGGDELLGYEETLGFWWGGNVFGQYDPMWDLAFHDADGDGARGMGAPGYGELDPTHGERLFVLDDTDGDGDLDADEQLAALGMSKIRAIREADGTVYRRGENLFESPGDYWGHGINVNGILAGGWPGFHAMVGVAPGVELLQAVVRYNEAPPLVIDLAEHLAWVVDEGADVVLIEDGEWVWEYMDGSSNLEIMMNEYAADGVIIVAATGNLAQGMHCLFDTSEGQTITIPEGAAASWPTFLWTDDTAFTVAVTPPVGPELILPLDGSVVTESGYSIYSQHSISPRGTHRLDLALETVWAGGLVVGDWRFRFVGPATSMHGFMADNVSGWISESSWQNGVVKSHDTTWPATADSCVSVGAWEPYSEPGLPAFFSGVGPRFDGVPVVDLLAPGFNVYCADPDRWRGYSEFGGTSAAAPFVAGAAALLKELDPTLDHARCRAYLRAGTTHRGVDPVGAGAGYLSIMGAVARLLDDMSTELIPTELAVDARPNPFNAATSIRFRQRQRGTATVRVFDLKGREVWQQMLDEAPEGWRTVLWDGRTTDDRTLPSGVYLAHVHSGGVAAAGKLTLVR